MSEIKTKSIKNLEERMKNISESTIRHNILKNAKSFKTSWIDLGQSLYTVWRDKLYKEWGYSSFDIYASKEIGIRKQTALKLLKSYYFLERKEPIYLKKEYTEDANAASLPTYESVNILRLASKKKELDEEDYTSLKANVLQKGKDAKDIRKDLATIIKERQELDPDVTRKKRKITLLKRFVSTLKSINSEIKLSKLLPAKLVNEANSLISKIEAEIS